MLARSVLDRTLFVLGRAAAVAAPAGVLIWCLGNITVNGESLLSHCAAFLDPAARLFGLDGVILLAFLLALPANELVLPLLLMGYLSQGALAQAGDLSQLHGLLLQNGWTWVTALCVMVFSLFHWPCSTTTLTVYKETHSLKWTAVAVLLPTLTGVTLCALVSALSRLLGRNRIKERAEGTGFTPGPSAFNVSIFKVTRLYMRRCFDFREGAWPGRNGPVRR